MQERGDKIKVKVKAPTGALPIKVVIAPANKTEAKGGKK